MPRAGQTARTTCTGGTPVEALLRRGFLHWEFVQNRAVPPFSAKDLRELRLRYNAAYAAYAAYQSCVLALSEAEMSGKKPSPELLKNETAALGESTDARAKLLAGMA